MRDVFRMACLLCLLVIVVTAGGCSRASSVVTPNPVEIDASEYARMFHAADRVLRDEGFAIARQDFRMGVVATQAVYAPTALEPWHTSNTTSDQILEASFNSQRRLVTVRLEPAPGTDPRKLAAPEVAAAPTTRPSDASATGIPPGVLPGAGTYLMRVEVNLERGQFPTRRLSGSTEGVRIYNHLSTSPAELRVLGITGPYWRPIGRDEALEQRLLAQIIRRSIDMH